MKNLARDPWNDSKLIAWQRLESDVDDAGDGVFNRATLQVSGVRDPRLLGKQVGPLRMRHTSRVSRFSKPPAQVWHGYDCGTGLLDALNKDEACSQPLSQGLTVTADSRQACWRLAVVVRETSNALFHLFDLFSKTHVPTTADVAVLEAVAGLLLTSDLSRLRVRQNPPVCINCGRPLSEVDQKFDMCTRCHVQIYAGR